MTISVYTPTDIAALTWESPDVYFTPGYGQACTTVTGGDSIVLEAFDGKWLAPLILQPVDQVALDAASPYGYAGIYAAPVLGEMDTALAWKLTLKQRPSLRLSLSRE